MRPGTGQNLGSEAILEPGDVFAGRYEVIEQIGMGGMGVVYKANDKVADRTIALKLIHPAFASNEQEFKRLKQEGLTARDIRHKNVVAVYDIGLQDQQPFITMELLEGQSLRDWHREFQKAATPVPVPKATYVVHQILDGLNAAHEKGVIHRDLKPENVMIATDSNNEITVKILDFGIASSIENDSQINQALGTRGYMAPEQLTSPDLAGPSADLYSVSVMFYELLADVVPQGHWQPPSGGRNDVPRQLDKLIERGLSNRPLNRVQTTQDYLNELARIFNTAGRVVPRQPAPNAQFAPTAQVSGPAPYQHGGPSSPSSNSSSTFDFNANPVMKWCIIGAAGFLGLIFVICCAAVFIDMNNPELVGDWSSTQFDNAIGMSQESSFSFSEDGTYTYYGSKSGGFIGQFSNQSANGEWSTSGDNLELIENGTTYQFEYKVSGDELRIWDNANPQLVFYRN